MAEKKKKDNVTEDKKSGMKFSEEEPYPVPLNWHWVTLGKVCEPLCDGVHYAPQYIPAGIPCFSAKDIYDDKIHQEKCFFITDNEYESMKEKIHIRTGSVLVTKSGSIGRSAVVTQFSKFGLVESIGVINPLYANSLYIKRLLDKGFVYSNEFLEQYTTGTTIKHLTLRLLASIPVPLPPYDEQSRIVDRIESLFAKLDEAKEKAQAVVDGYEDRKAAILHKAFTGELTKEWRKKENISFESWQPTSSNKIFSYITSGSRGWAQYYSDSGAVFIRMGNLDHGTIELDLSDIQRVNLPNKAEGQRSQIKNGDILISITADIGMVGLVKNISFEGYINQHIALARPFPEENSEFIAWYLVSDVGLSQLKHKQRGATKVGLGLDDIRSLVLNMPVLKEQKEIIKQIASLISKQRAAKEAADQVISKIDAMKKAILARAFRGELGTNDPSEEPVDIGTL